MSLAALVIPVTPFAQNCSLIWCDRTLQGAVIDPGGDLGQIRAAATEHGVRLAGILLTHAHIDHAGATAALAREMSLTVEGPAEGDRYWIDRLPEQARMFGFPEAEPFEPDRWLNDGDVVRVGEETLEVYHCPGHTPGHVVFFSRAGRLAFVGDVLFAGSIGRTDFPGGDHPTLVRSITEKLWPLGDDVVFVPGHGPASTFGQERRENPFVGDQALAAKR